MISLSDVSMRFGPQVLFEGVAWRLGPGRHYGLVGANGSGKSTLLRLMAGELKPEGGTVSRPNDLVLGVLPQDHTRYDAELLLDVVLQGKRRLWEALREKARLMAMPAGGEGGGASAEREAHGHRLAELEAAIADEDGYTAESRAAALLEGLGLPTERHRKPMGVLSGGYRLRVLLAQTLFQQAQLLLLDEPTNHLDIVSIRWLEGYLRGYPGTVVLVSHDRHFLNGVCSDIADLDYQALTLYPGNYERFLAAKVLDTHQKEVETERLEKKIAETQQFIDRFRAKATKARQANSRQKQVERMQKAIPVIKTSSRRYPRFRFECVRPSGQEVLAVRDVTKGYGGPPVLRGVSFELRRGQKLAVVGPNGIGKTTLLKLIVGGLEPDAGQLKLGYEVHLGYFGQEDRSALDGKTSLVDWLYGAAPGETVGVIRGTLGRVLFSGDDVEKATGALSGGEAARLILARLMLQRGNLLVLDEPTNHLDLEGREALLDALQAYEGTLVFVSHDRHFVSSLADRVLALTPEGIDEYPGTYEEYLEREGADYLTAEAAGPSRLPAATAPREKGGESRDFTRRKATKRETARLNRKVGRLEREVQQLEGKLAGFDARFAEPGYFENTPWEEVAHAEREKAACQAELETKLADWEAASTDLDAMTVAS